MTMTGRCLCGDVTFTGHGDPGSVHVCHCSDCARWSGGPFLGITFKDGVTVNDGPVRWFASSEWAERGSCSKCGSAMFWRLKDGSSFTVTAGTLEDKASLGPVSEHIFADQKPSYYDFKDDAPRLTAEEALAKFMADAGQA